jgi:gliding motility-associated-like protein
LPHDNYSFMRKLLLLFGLSLILNHISAQLTSTGYRIPNVKDVDYVFVFDGITSSSTITYTGNGTTVNWYKTTDLTNSISNQTDLSPEDSVGYTLIVDGTTVAHCWVMDYKKRPPFLKFEASKFGSQCKSLTISINDSTGIKPIKYFSADLSKSYEFPRQFKVTYKTKKWVTDAWEQRDTTITVSLTSADKFITLNDPPLCNTTFSIKGEEYTTTPITFKSSEYTAVAVKSNMTSVLALRTEKNEKEKPDKTDLNQKLIKGSAPLDVQFLSNATEPVVESYKWDFFLDKNLIISRLDKDQRYTFNEKGNYLVKMTASSKSCTCMDSITVQVVESYLFVPRVFTPNGDGIQDEFRVGYKSLASFECWVYNRWGKLVYHWNDPQRGWDGTINGQKASSGPYFYVIQAVGTDKITYKKSGDINLLRGKDE